MLHGQIPGQQSVPNPLDVYSGTTDSFYSGTTDSIFRPGIEHQKRTKQILALFEEEKMLEQAGKLDYDTNMSPNHFVSYMGRRFEVRSAYLRKVEKNNRLVTSEAMSEGLHPEVRHVIEERLRSRSA